MDQESFASIVAEALDSLPPEFAHLLHNVEVRIEPRPRREHRRLLGLKPWQQLYGFYEGTPLTERVGGNPLLPDMITIFQVPLEQDFRQPAALCAQVRRTVLHELAHFFGISDDRLRELDAY